MPRARIVGVCPLMAGLVSSLAAAFAQDGGGAPAPAPAAAARKDARPTRAPQVQGDPARMEKILKDWEGQSAKLKSLDLQIYRIDLTPAWKEENHYDGRAVFKSPEMAYLHFNKIKTAANAKGQVVPQVDPKTKGRVTTSYETIICNGNEVWQYLYDGRQIFVYPLAKEQRKRALDEGPLPFLFNMKAEEAKQRYAMTLRDESEKSYWVEIQPRLQADQESFRTAWVHLDREFLLPIRIVLLAPDGKSTKDFRLSDIQPNRSFEDRFFQGGVPPRKAGDPRPPWKVVHNPQALERPPGAAAAAPRRPAEQPALRPGPTDRQPRR